MKPGRNTITRDSTQSNLTIPFERTFRNLDETPEGGEALEQYNFCGCGWPQHMLVPKGKPEGMQCQLFVMISDFEDDKVSDEQIAICPLGNKFQFFPVPSRMLFLEILPHSDFFDV